MGRRPISQGQQIPHLLVRYPLAVHGCRLGGTPGADDLLQGLEISLHTTNLISWPGDASKKAGLTYLSRGDASTRNVVESDVVVSVVEP